MKTRVYTEKNFPEVDKAAESGVALPSPEVPPHLRGRKALCEYGCRSSLVPSSHGLAFFRYMAGKEYDAYYCGCFGWD